VVSGLQRGRNRPPGAIARVMRAILWFTGFGGRFRFPGGRFLQVMTYSNVYWFQKSIFVTLESQHMMHVRLH